MNVDYLGGNSLARRQTLYIFAATERDDINQDHSNPRNLFLSRTAGCKCISKKQKTAVLREDRWNGNDLAARKIKTRG